MDSYSGGGKGLVIGIIVVVVILIIGGAVAMKGGNNSGAGGNNSGAPPAPPAPPKYDKIGCYKDTGDRALPILAPGIGPNQSESQIEKCANWAKAQGYKIFGLQYGGECWADTNEKTANPATSYARYGTVPCSTRGGFPDGTGDGWQNHVYGWDRLE